MNKSILIIIFSVSLLSIGATTKDFRISDNDGDVLKINTDGSIPVTLSGVASAGVTYVTNTPDGTLTAEQAMSSYATGFVTNTTSTGRLGIRSIPILVSDGGIGVTTTPGNGFIPIGNGTGYTIASITSGTNITVTNATGTITIAATGGAPGGVNKDLQYNSGGVFAGNANFRYKSEDNILIISSSSTQVAPVLNVTEDGGVSIFSVAVNSSMTGVRNNAAGFTAGDSLTSGTDNTLYGNNSGTSLTTENNNTLLGSGAGDVLTAANATCIGLDSCGAATTATNLTAVGANAGLSVTGNSNTLMGSSAGQSATTMTNSVILGSAAAASGTITANAVIAIGQSAASNVTSGSDLIAIGTDSCDAVTTGQNIICLGQLTTVLAASNSQVAIGRGSETTAANQMSIGGDGAYAINSLYIGESVTNATPANLDINATGGSGTNIAGADMTLASGKSTGQGASGVVNIAIASSNTVSGTGLNSLTNIATFRNSSGVASFDITGVFRSSRTTDLGWSVQNAANQACNTTCVNACVFGMDTAALGNFLACDNAASDTCICAGPT